jgi:hypothetical protein
LAFVVVSGAMGNWRGRFAKGFGPAACAALAACAGSPGARAPEGARGGVGPGTHDDARAGTGSTPPAGAPSRASYGPGDSDLDHRDPARAPRALVFRAAGFPTVDAPAIDDSVLDTAFSGLPVDRASNVNELVTRLVLRDVDVLVLPYGSAFPVEAWPRIRSFLKRGGGLAVLGGAPFHEPVRAEAPGARTWLRGPRQTSFAHDLLMGPAEAVARPANAKTLLARGIKADSGFTAAFPDPKTTWALTLRLATKPDMPDEHGSAGPRDAIARPLVHVLDAAGTPRGCPLLEIDHHRGDAAGARWVLATSDARLDAPIVRAIVSRALEGASELRAQPVRAAVEVGDQAHVRVTQRRFVVRSGDDASSRARVVVKDEQGHEVYATDITLVGTAESRTAVVPIKAKLAPGLHHVTIDSVSEKQHPRVARTGFVVRDEKLFANAPKLSVSRDWLRKDGKVFPVIGTTYMASDVHRKFLFEPNPHVWDADFEAMQKRGVNFVRTGLWTAWSRAMVDPGAIDENALAALDAFVHAAARHGIVVCFNLFAFLPPSYTGDNPYLDPRALEGQREMLTLFASRYRGNGWVHWDLINEPSYAPRAALWSTRAIGDPHEKRAWASWVRARHGDDPAKLRALWHDPSDDPMSVPRPEDFSQAFVQVARRPRKVRDFHEFSQEVVAGWAARMRDIVHVAGKDPLVTLGQDEGGIYERPTQQLMAASLDYTAVHTWWKNDDLLWDGVLTKVPEKPSLHQETGLMRLEDIDGTPWRSPDIAARLLERKVAYAFLGRGTGVVEWAWNVNPYMPIDEEATIGLFRPDGTAKPELDPIVDAAAFFRVAAPLLDDFEPDPVVLVVPHARAFLGRTNAIDATKIVVRALAERFGVVPTGISDLRLTPARLKGVKLVLVPSADVLDEAAAKAILDASRAGTKVLFTGPIEGDSYGLETPSLRALGVLGPSRPVAVHEKSAWSASGWVAFESLLQESVRRADKPSSMLTNGPVWHEPLQLELGREREPLVKLLEAALAGAAVPTSPGEWGLCARALVAPRAVLITVVNERPERAVRRVSADGKAFDIPVAALGARLTLVERGTGRIVASTPGEAVTVAAH